MTFQFYSAVTVNRAQIRKTFAKLEDGFGSLKPLQHVMFTPIAKPGGPLDEVKQLTAQYDLNVMFDSGGYEVQVGNRSFDELYAFLLDFYQDNQWGHRYVLPDNVPLSQDDDDTVERKVDETIDTSRLCFRRLVKEVQDRSLAVAQGHTPTQIARCLEAYADLDGLKHVGFGSFGTSGVSNGVNMITDEAFQNLQWAVQRAHEADMTVHAFGVGGPTSIPLLYEAGVDSFDTTSWMRSSGYGNVFFPFKSRFNASHKRTSGKVLTKDKLVQMKAETDHECAFCESIEQLQDSRWNRIIHNLIVLHEMSNQIRSLSRDEIIGRMDPESNYRRRLQKATQTTPAIGD